MLVRPCCVAARILHHVEDGVVTNVIVRIDRRAAILWIAWQIVRIDPVDPGTAVRPPGIKLQIVVVNLFVEPNLRTNHAGAKLGTADNAVRGGLRRGRQCAIVADIVENSRRTRRPARDLSHQAGEGIGRFRSQRLQVMHSGGRK